MFDRPSLYNMLLADKNNGHIQYFTRSSNILPGFDSSNNIAHRGIVPPDTQTLDVRASFPYYSDQIPPFDVAITFANEYGQAAARSLYGLEILNEGSGASMDDVVIEETMTFVARELGPMVSTTRDFSNNLLDTTVVTP
jgi:hypothetical protein